MRRSECPAPSKSEPKQEPGGVPASGRGGEVGREAEGLQMEEEDDAGGEREDAEEGPTEPKKKKKKKRRRGGKRDEEEFWDKRKNGGMTDRRGTNEDEANPTGQGR